MLVDLLRLIRDLFDLLDIVLAQRPDLGQYLSLTFTLPLGKIQANGGRDQGHGKGLVPFRCEHGI